MPSLPEGENAECETNFISNASVGGPRRNIDSTHATITVTNVKLALQLQITIWVPEGVSAHVMEHEEGHRQISEAYYQTADQIALRVAGGYSGREVEVTGADLDAEANQALQRIGAEITDEYNRQLNPNPAQLLYDSITDHSRNDVSVQEAVEHTLKNIAVESQRPGSTAARDAR